VTARVISFRNNLEQRGGLECGLKEQGPKTLGDQDRRLSPNDEVFAVGARLAPDT
jgi:hypothetical protein